MMLRVLVLASILAGSVNAGVHLNDDCIAVRDGYCIGLTKPGTWMETYQSCPKSNITLSKQEEREFLDNVGIKGKAIWVDEFHLVPEATFPELYQLLPRTKWKNTEEYSCKFVLNEPHYIQKRDLFSQLGTTSVDTSCASKLPRVCLYKDNQCPQNFLPILGLNSTCGKIIYFENPITAKKAKSICEKISGSQLPRPNEYKYMEGYDDCSSFIPVWTNFTLSNGKFEAVDLSDPNRELTLVGPNYKFECVICLKETRNAKENQGVTLKSGSSERENKSNGSTKHLILTFSEIELWREIELVQCYTNASATPAKISFDSHKVLEIKFNQTELYRAPNMILRSTSQEDPFFFQNLDENSVNEIPFYYINTVGSSFEIIIDINSTGHYVCMALNKITLLPIITDTVSIEVPNNGRYLRYAVLLQINSEEEPQINSEEDLQINIVKQFQSSEDEFWIGEYLAERLNVTEGIMDLKMISNGNKNLLYHITLKSSHQPLTTIEDAVNFDIEGAISIIYIRSTDECPSMQIGNINFPATQLGNTSTQEMVSYGTHVTETRRCSGNFLEGAFWGISQETTMTHSTTFLTSSDIEPSTLETTTLDSTTKEFIYRSEIHAITIDTWTDTMITQSNNNFEKKNSSDPLELNSLPSKRQPPSPPQPPSSIPLTTSPTLTEPPPPTPPPTIQNFEDIIKNLTLNPVESSSLPEISETINTILSLSDNVNPEVLQDLEKILTNMILVPGAEVQDVRPLVSVLVADVTQENPVVGIALSRENDGDTLRSLKAGDVFKSIDTEVAVSINRDIVKGNTRLAFAVFTNCSVIKTNNKVNSRIINIILNKDNVPAQFSEGQYIDIVFKPIQEGGKKKECVFWAGVEMEWSSKGCALLENKTDLNMDICRCNHLTHFAEIITGGSRNIVEAHTFALEVISIAGSILSLIGIFIIGITAVVFKNWRLDIGNQILLNLSAALALNLISYLLIYSGVGGSKGAGCVAIGAILHYSVLSCFCWMLIMSVLQIIRLLTMVGNQGVSYLVLKACAIGWIVPLIPVIILLAWDTSFYTSNPSSSFERDFCYPSGAAFYVTIAAPVGLIVLINLVIYTVITCRVCSCFGWGKLSEGLSRHGLSERTLVMRRLRTLIFLFFLFGISWTFGLLAKYLFFTYLFCFTATLQGFFIFFFFFVIEKKSRSYWKKTFDKSTQSKSTEATVLFESVPLRGLDEESFVEQSKTTKASSENTSKSFGTPDSAEDGVPKRVSGGEARKRSMFHTFK